MGFARTVATPAAAPVLVDVLERRGEPLGRAPRSALLGVPLLLRSGLGMSGFLAESGFRAFASPPALGSGSCPCHLRAGHPETSSDPASYACQHSPSHRGPGSGLAPSPNPESPSPPGGAPPAGGWIGIATGALARCPPPLGSWACGLGVGPICAGRHRGHGCGNGDCCGCAHPGGGSAGVVGSGVAPLAWDWPACGGPGNRCGGGMRTSLGCVGGHSGARLPGRRSAGPGRGQPRGGLGGGHSSLGGARCGRR